MMPFIPPPPSCAARSVQDAGKTTRKLIGLAAGSIGAIAPSTAQYAAAVSVGAVHFGSAQADARNRLADRADRNRGAEFRGRAVRLGDRSCARRYPAAARGCLWSALSASGQRRAALGKPAARGVKRARASGLEFIGMSMAQGSGLKAAGKSFEIYSKVFPEP